MHSVLYKGKDAEHKQQKIPAVNVPIWKLYSQPLDVLSGLLLSGDCVKIRTPWPVYLINDPQLAHHILKQTNIGFSKDTFDYRLFNDFVAPGIISSSGERWRKSWDAGKQCLGHGQLEQMQPVLDKALARLTERLEQARIQGLPIDAAQCLNLVSYSVICYLVFGVEVSEEQLEFAQQLESLRFSITDGLMLIWKWLPMAANSRMQHIHAGFNRLIHELSQQSEKKAVPCLYSALKQVIPPEQLNNELKNFIFSGSTVTNLLVWCLYALATEEAAAAKVHGEVTAYKGQSMDKQALASFTYTRCFIKEVMRLYPPVWLMSRRCTQEHAVEGHQFYPGDVVWVSPWTLHRNPCYWRDANSFQPQRFCEADSDNTAYIPFSTGPRMCLGRHFGMNEAMMTVATLASRYRFNLVEPKPVTLDTLVSVKYGGRLLLQVG